MSDLGGLVTSRLRCIGMEDRRNDIIRWKIKRMVIYKEEIKAAEAASTRLRNLLVCL